MGRWAMCEFLDLRVHVFGFGEPDRVPASQVGLVDTLAVRSSYRFSCAGRLRLPEVPFHVQNAGDGHYAIHHVPIGGGPLQGLQGSGIGQFDHQPPFNVFVPFWEKTARCRRGAARCRVAG